MAKDERNRHQALLITKNLLGSRINAIDATRALLPLLRNDGTIAMPEDRKTLLRIAGETDDLPVGQLREECHPDILLERDKQLSRYEKLFGQQVRSICERIARHLERAPFNYVGPSDLHDGYVRSVWREGEQAAVIVQNENGHSHVVRFKGVTSVEMSAPENMVLHAVSEAPTNTAGVQLYEFINWYYDQPDRPESTAYLRIRATSFTVDRA